MSKMLFGYKNKNYRDLFLLCWAAYFSTYICRLNFSAVMPEIANENVFTSGQIASVSSAFFISYGLGQFISGILGDKLNTRLMIFFGLLISSASNILIFFFHSFPALITLWAINGIVQSLVWSPVLKTASIYFDKSEKEKFGVDISTTVPLGTLASYGVSLLTLIFLPWKYVFLTCGLCELLFAILWIATTKSLFKKLKPITYNNLNNENVKVMNLKSTIKLMLSSGVFIMLIPIAIQGTLKDSVTQWIPTFFSSKFGSATSFSLALTMILPIINVTGAYFAKALNKKIKNELTTSLVFFGVSAVFLLILKLFGSANLTLSLICMAAVTNCMFAINVMLITMVPLWFNKSGRVSTIGGFLNAMAYIGCGGLNILAGIILENGSNWNSLFIMWLMLAVIACVLSAVCIPLWKRFVIKES